MDPLYQHPWLIFVFLAVLIMIILIIHLILSHRRLIKEINKPVQRYYMGTDRELYRF